VQREAETPPTFPGLKEERLQRGGFSYTIRPLRQVEKELISNREGLICKDLTVEINSIQLVFLAVVR
jgi:hypothetical protein